MRTYIAVALCRNRLLFIGLTLCFAASLPFAVMLLRATGHPGSDGLNGALAFWFLTGIPGAGLLFGASSGVRLRHESERSAEQPLPLSARARVVSACLAAGAHVLFFSLLVSLTVFIFGKGWFAAPDRIETWIQTYPELHGFMVVIAFATAHLVLTGFVLAYLIGNGILGGILSLAASLTPAFCLVMMLALRVEYEGLAPFSPLGPLCILAAFGGALRALFAAPAWIERGARAPWFSITAGLLAGALCFTVALFHRWDRLNRTLTPIGHEAEGDFLTTVRGDLLLTTRDGVKSLLPAENRSLRDLLEHPWYRRVVGVEWEKDGSLWALLVEGVFTEQVYQLWHGRPEGTFMLHTSFADVSYPMGLFRKGRELRMGRFSGSGSRQYAPLPGKSRAPQWREAGS